MSTIATKRARRRPKLDLVDEILAGTDPFPMNEPNPFANLGLPEAAPSGVVELMKNLQREKAAREKHEAVAAAVPLQPSSFPLEALPQTLRKWVEGISRQAQCAPETAALLALAASAAAIENRAQVNVVADWVEPLNLYVALATTPGDQSDAVLEAATSPLAQMECDNFMRYDPNSVENGDPPRRHLSELTARSLHYHLSRRSRIACFSPQGEVFRQLAGRNSPSRERLVRVLEDCHQGKSFVAELTRGKEEWVDCPHVTIASLIDRSTIDTIARQRNCPARTLLSRFLFADPVNRASCLRVTYPISPQAIADYHDGIHRLARHPGGHLRFEPAALAMLQGWLGHIDAEMNGGKFAPLALWAKQLGSTTVRIAGILHCWVSQAQEISADTLSQAIEIARWLVPQAAAMLDELGAADDDCTEHERAVLQLARDAGEFSGKSAWQRLRKRLVRPANLRAILNSLVERGHLSLTGKRFALVTPLERILGNSAVADECATGTPAELAPPDSPAEVAAEAVA